MGAMITQRPDLFRAVICAVPLLDMLRYQNFQIAKLWIPEYGSAEDPKQFDFIYAYSPYHHVKPGEEYPAILFMTADTDTRVDPMHAKKMAALMQAEAKTVRAKRSPSCCASKPKPATDKASPSPSKSKRTLICTRSSLAVGDDAVSLVVTGPNVETGL